LITADHSQKKKNLKGILLAPASHGQLHVACPESELTSEIVISLTFLIAGLIGRGISPLQVLYLQTKQINAYIHASERDSNRQSHSTNDPKP